MQKKRLAGWFTPKVVCLLPAFWLLAACGDAGGGGGNTDTASDGIPIADGDTNPDGDSDTEEDAEELFTHDTQPNWISIPPGSFQMGCVPQDMDCNADENPRHAVTVTGFGMTRTEIIQAQYKEATGSNPNADDSPGGECLNCPVWGVTWEEAEAFCETAGGRLPSEAQWEYAARAGTETVYYCGNEEACLDGIAWYYENANGKAHKVGGKEPNAFGLYDMLGNVWEWTADCRHDTYDGAPVDGSVWGPAPCDMLVLRGGGWNQGYVGYVRTSARDFGYPGMGGEGFSHHGFRCVR